MGSAPHQRGGRSRSQHLGSRRDPGDAGRIQVGGAAGGAKHPPEPNPHCTGRGQQHDRGEPVGDRMQARRLQGSGGVARVE